ncbi:FAD-dependent oxidoreductase [Reyranella sp. CPCC 100927]|uniref:FAD-dependent oxidoreductase n=1 Tax=Reyranella sp. CPCC 100927 TaxID=2599616 RepID=UPI001C49C786|nr:FAD-dependent oxidoreductase [Reyranella sp. CPCC 100927]
MSLRIAVVGSGPSGFYAAEALLERDPTAVVDLFDRMPAPYGLVRSGVAPDHQKTKRVQLVFEGIARSDRVSFLGNVAIGVDVTVEELSRHYHGIVLATGAAQPRPLGIPGETLHGVYSAFDFVAWYNGNPDQRDLAFDFSGENAAIIGHGNVALDVCRILASPADRLRGTDIAHHALEAIKDSRLRQISLIGRRGPAQAKFSLPELKALGDLEGWAIEVKELEAIAGESQALSENQRRIVESLHKLQAKASPANGRRIVIRFLEAPVALIGTDRLEAVHLRRPHLVGEPYLEPCDLLLYSAGFGGVAVPGVPFCRATGVIPHRDGRVIAEDGATVPGRYVVGWIKRGASGTIGTNRGDSNATIDAVLADRPALMRRDLLPSGALMRLLSARTQVVGFDDWLHIDAAERTQGTRHGKPREKFTRVREMLDCALSRHAPGVRTSPA